MPETLILACARKALFPPTPINQLIGCFVIAIPGNWIPAVHAGTTALRLVVRQYAENTPRISLVPTLQRGNSSSNAPALRDAGASLAAFPRRSVGTIGWGLFIASYLKAFPSQCRSSCFSKPTSVAFHFCVLFCGCVTAAGGILVCTRLRAPTHFGAVVGIISHFV